MMMSNLSNLDDFELNLEGDTSIFDPFYPENSVLDAALTNAGGRDQCRLRKDEPNNYVQTRAPDTMSALSSPPVGHRNGAGLVASMDGLRYPGSPASHGCNFQESLDVRPGKVITSFGDLDNTKMSVSDGIASNDKDARELFHAEAVSSADQAVLLLRPEVATSAGATDNQYLNPVGTNSGAIEEERNGPPSSKLGTQRTPRQQHELDDARDVVFGKYVGQDTTATKEFWGRLQKEFRPEYRDPACRADRKKEIEKILLDSGRRSFFRCSKGKLLPLSEQRALLEIRKKLKERPRGIKVGNRLIPDFVLGHFDVLGNQGGQSTCNFHPGTKYYWEQILEYRPEYLIAEQSPGNKTAIAEKVIMAVQKKGGRFVVKDKEDGGYQELSQRNAEKKIMNAFRDGHVPQWAN